MNTEKQSYIQEDEIDLRELFKVIWAKRWFIILFTTVVTTGAIIYAFMKTPIYKAKALVEIGNYKLDSNREYLDNESQLSQKLNVLYIDMIKNIKNNDAVIVSITVPKKQKNFIEITAEGISNPLAIEKINEVVKYIQNEHSQILKEVKQRRELEIKHIEEQIENTKNKEIKFLEEKIIILEEWLHSYKKQIKAIDSNIKKIENINPTLTVLRLMEKRDLNNFILNLNLQILEMKNKKDELETAAINKLLEKRTLLLSMLLPHNYKNSAIIGKVITKDYPVKPKKRLIVVVAFVTGFILSIFLVFFIEFIRGLKEKD